MDLLPTALGIAGLPCENRTLGRDMLNCDRPSYALTFGGGPYSNPKPGLLGSDYYYSMLRDGRNSGLYSLDKASRDHELSAAEPELAADRRAWLRGLCQTAR